MNTEIDTIPDINSSHGTIKDVTEKVAHTAKDVTEAVEHIAKDVGHATKQLCHHAATKVEDQFQASKEYVRRNPVPVVLGAIAFGSALGCLVMMARRKPTFRERYAEEPLHAVRDVIREALAPVTHRVHQGYDSAKDGAGRSVHSLFDHLGSVGNRLKFW